MRKSNASGISVVHVIDSGGFGGGERYLADLIRHASSGIRHAAIIPFYGPLAREFADMGAVFAVTKMPAWFSPLAVSRIVHMISARRADIIHSHGYRANIYARAAALVTGAASVCTVHVSLYDYAL
ncbi:MAG: glycosyltransferase [Deltaproteobacteria bacterium]|nr:glycosyltransferase [Deltaproteobacteria bacterium]